MRKGSVSNQASDLIWGLSNMITRVASVTKQYEFSGRREAGL